MLSFQDETTALFVAILAGIGALTLCWIVLVGLKFLVAISSSADFQTAITPKLPLDAFRGKVVWLTGASSGLGRELALLLATHGAHLILSARRKEKLEQVADECRAKNRAASVTVLPLDLNLSDGSLADRAKEALKIHEGTIHILINNAGVGMRVLARDASDEVDRYVCRLDYLAHIELTKAVLPTMERNGGTIINILSVCGKVGAPVRTAYCGAKFALRGYMEALRTEIMLLRFNVHILNVFLGSTNTGGYHSNIANIQEDGAIQTFQGVDQNIEAGMRPTFVAERVLAVAYQGRLPECWIAAGKELALLYLAQYLPITGVAIAMKCFARNYLVRDKKRN